jgi:hypothetical protein
MPAIVACGCQTSVVIAGIELGNGVDYGGLGDQAR